MTAHQRLFAIRFGWLLALLAVLIAGCGGGSRVDPILGSGGAAVRPMVTATSPVATPAATGVATNARISAAFSKAMDAMTLTNTSFMLACPASTAVNASVGYDAAARVATLTPSAALPPGVACIATVTTAVRDTSGLALEGQFSWSFTTSATVDIAAPTIALTMPRLGATDVANNSQITATFSEDINPATISGDTFTVVNTALGTPVPGTVSYSVVGRSAVFTPSTALPNDSPFTATVTTGVTDLAGNALATNAVWSFSTAALPDSSRPTVLQTQPAPSASAVASNTRIVATFSESMNPATISATSFTLLNTTTGVAVPGAVSYSAASRTASFTPTTPSVLANDSSFTATLTTAATDLAGNALAGNTAVLPAAGNHVWRFSTAALSDTTAPTVTALNPQDGATLVCLTKAVNASFSEPMDVATINTSTFTVSDNGVPVDGTVSYEPISQLASFVPSNAAGFAPSRAFVVTVLSGSAGVADLAGNPLAANRSWGFSTGTQPCIAAVNLRTAASLGAFGGGAGLTNQGVNTVVNGNLGTTAVCTAITGFHDAANVYTQTPLNVGVVNGGIYCAPPAPGTTGTQAIATQALADAQTAYNALAAMPPGSDPGAGQLGGLTLPAAVYTAAGGTFAITNGDLTLDAQGDANAVWVFQSAAALTVGQPALPRNVRLINGAQARNVFWQIGSAGRIEDRSVMVGTLIAPAGVTISTPGQTAQTTLIGRAIGLTASVTMVNTTVVAP